MSEESITDSYELFNPSTIKDGNYVMIRLPSENNRVHKITKGSTINLGKFGTFRADDIIGHPFGYTYEIVGEHQLRIVKEEFVEDKNELEPDEHNQDLRDDPLAQTLTMEQIEELKKQSVDGGRELIERVTNSHVAFDKKTTFSQDKYLKRKQQKFWKRFTPIPIGSTELIDYYNDKDVDKIKDISEETLGLILSLANVKPGGCYLVVDDLNGVLVAAMLERMAGEGTIVIAHDDEHPKLDALKFLNLSEEYINAHVKSINWLDFLEPEEADKIETKSPEELASMKRNAVIQYHRKKRRYDAFKNVRALIDAANFDGLIIGTELYVPTLIPHLIPVVGGSRPIVVYDAAKEALVETTHVLQKDLRVLAPTILETRVRRYQTLPGRMHPHMTMRGGGGYVLWGTRVYPSENVNAVGSVRGNKKRKVEETEGESKKAKLETKED